MYVRLRMWALWVWVQPEVEKWLFLGELCCIGFHCITLPFFLSTSVLWVWSYWLKCRGASVNHVSYVGKAYTMACSKNMHNTGNEACHCECCNPYLFTDMMCLNFAKYSVSMFHPLLLHRSLCGNIHRPCAQWGKWCPTVGSIYIVEVRENIWFSVQYYHL